jgi:hypothetical protein
VKIRVHLWLFLYTSRLRARRRCEILLKLPLSGQFGSGHWAVIFAFNRFQSGIAYENFCSKDAWQPFFASARVDDERGAGAAAGA